MEWSTDTKNDYDDMKVYLAYGYVFVSSTVRNHAKLAFCFFNIWYQQNKANSQFQMIHDNTDLSCFHLHLGVVPNLSDKSHIKAEIVSTLYDFWWL